MIEPMQLTATQALAYLGGLAAVIAIIANSIKIYEFAAARNRASRAQASTAEMGTRRFGGSFFLPFLA